LLVPARSRAESGKRFVEFPTLLVFQLRVARVPSLDSVGGDAKLAGEASRLSARHVFVHACGKVMVAERPEFPDRLIAPEPTARTNQRQWDAGVFEWARLVGIVSETVG
jgi:hypothetical protein